MRNDPASSSKRRWRPYATFITLLLLCSGSAGAQNVGMGTRYVQLDAQAHRTETDFGGVRAISVRHPDGSLETTLENTQGEELARLSFLLDRRIIRLDEAQGQGPSFSAPPFLDVTSDWANAQLFSLWQDRAQGAGLGLLATPVFDGYFFRHPLLANAGNGTAQEHHRAIHTRVRRVKTEFAIVTVEAVDNTKLPTERAPDTVYSTFTTRLLDPQTDKPLGVMQWFSEAQTLSWKIGSQPSNFIDPKRLAKAHLPGWPFEPTLAWSNLQFFSFFNDDTEHRLEDAERDAALAIDMWPAGPPGPASTGFALRPKFTPKRFPVDTGSALRAVAAATCTLEPDGCTCLHWLDGTIYRECCDEHDRCYYKDRAECCTFWSWFFPWQQGWTCAECNVDVVWCFITGGGGGGGEDGSGGMEELNECYLDIDEYFCPAQCASCTGGAWPTGP